MLRNDSSLEESSAMSVEMIAELCDVSLKSTYFHFRDEICQEKDGEAMYLSVTAVAPNLYMEWFELKPLTSTTSKPHKWSGMWMTHALLSRRLLKWTARPPVWAKTRLAICEVPYGIGTNWNPFFGVYSVCYRAVISVFRNPL